MVPFAGFPVKPRPRLSATQAGLQVCSRIIHIPATCHSKFDLVTSTSSDSNEIEARNGSLGDYRCCRRPARGLRRDQTSIDWSSAQRLCSRTTNPAFVRKYSPSERRLLVKCILTLPNTPQMPGRDAHLQFEKWAREYGTYMHEINAAHISALT